MNRKITLSLASLAAALTAAFGVAMAGTAYADSAPVVVTQAANSIASTSVNLNGTVNPEGQDATYEFEYGTSLSYGSEVPVSAGGAGSGTTALPVTATANDLTAGTAYHFRLVATNATGTTDGADVQFVAGADEPAVTLNAATDVTGGSATLSGTVNPEGFVTTYQFNYGTTTSLGSSTAVTGAGSGTSPVNASAGLTSLVPETTYYYQIEADIPTGGTTEGLDHFTTPAPVLSDGHSTAVAPTREDISWASTVEPGSWKLTIAGPGPINGQTNTVSIPAGAYTGLESGHTYTVTVQQLVGGVAEGTAGKITFVTES